jgi:hypothetical protein
MRSRFPGVRLVDRLAGVSQRHPALALLVAAVPIMAVEASFGPDGNTGGWERLTYVVFFLYGYLLLQPPVRAHLATPAVVGAGVRGTGGGPAGRGSQDP